GFLVGGQRGSAAERRGARGGDVRQDVGDGVEATGLDVFTADAHDRLCGFYFNLTNARAGHLDAVQGGGFLSARGFLGEGDARAGNGGCARNEREGDRVAELGGLECHLSLQVRLGKFPWEPAGNVKQDAKFGKVKGDTSPLWREI